MLKSVLLFSAIIAACAASAAEIIKIGIIGLDTSHSIEFAKLLNAETPSPEYAGCRVVAAYPQGSRDIASSTNRVPGYIEKVKPFGVEIVDSIDTLLKKVDAVLLESNDGRVHLEQALPVFKAGKRVFIDKPIAGSLPHVLALFEAAKRHNVPMFSSSSLRYTLMTQEIRSGKHGAVVGVDAFSPCSLEATHPDLFWYGIHGVETLFTLMGTGCESVVRVSTPGTDLAIGTWHGGRIGTFRGNRDSRNGYGATAFLAKGLQRVDDFKGYGLLLAEIVTFFKSGVAPVKPEETIELFAFMEAADESKRRGGVPVRVDDVLAKAKVEAAKISLE
ncbi:MAG TPA: Gfo/Idh/MocA family oxidoreductase [Kiritimatiellia bacterium]|jgi:predicted dehydrogenase|nr:Gfo/Idh/MocA family oxidoreductase [Kiritimatiellia bacterium]HPO37377.1 Gfo/Idh/MocA family oxidoreductase [Kiritimatiellia bacterium]HQA38236.1 Gfo/Idh/MocA family oxidoreductase [Kiritimatiellia bacterium]HQL50505.1 Gfo/Idh/MocA family oxidoreductase [Kiritimatiellia bacterium]